MTLINVNVNIAINKVSNEEIFLILSPFLFKSLVPYSIIITFNYVFSNSINFNNSVNFAIITISEYNEENIRNSCRIQSITQWTFIFINEAKRIINPDVTIAVMSSSFAMRGDVMVIDKFTRTKLMLEFGIDIVLELPFISAVQSTDYFCFNAINILNSFNITHLAFGAELANLEKLRTLNYIISQKSFQKYIKDSLDKGHSYPTVALKP